jgi:hypothetical protein
MAGEEKQSGSVSCHTLREVFDRTFHGGLIGVGEKRDVKVEATQGVCEIRRIVDGIGEGMLTIGSIPNDKGRPVCRLGESRNRSRPTEAPYDQYYQA